MTTLSYTEKNLSHKIAYFERSQKNAKQIYRLGLVTTRVGIGLLYDRYTYLPWFNDL